MGKCKPRHNPDKPQNNYGGDGDCPIFEVRSDNGNDWCHDHFAIPWKPSLDENGRLPCKGNLHNCKKMKLKWLASMPEHKRELWLERYG